MATTTKYFRMIPYPLNIIRSRFLTNLKLPHFLCSKPHQFPCKIKTHGEILQLIHEYSLILTCASCYQWPGRKDHLCVLLVYVIFLRFFQKEKPGGYRRRRSRTVAWKFTKYVTKSTSIFASAPRNKKCGNFICKNALLKLLTLSFWRPFPHLDPPD